MSDCDMEIGPCACGAWHGEDGARPKSLTASPPPKTPTLQSSSHPMFKVNLLGDAQDLLEAFEGDPLAEFDDVLKHPEIWGLLERLREACRLTRDREAETPARVHG